jgi:undecaprenyl-phosphate 4-deoxy-4-formamido-L-arabinose transferase
MAGIVIALLSLVFVAYLAVRRLIVGPEAEGVFTLFGIAFFLIGMALLGLGVVGEYVGRIYEQVRQRPRYTIAALLGGDGEPAQLPEAHPDRGAQVTALPPSPTRTRGEQE